MIGLAKSYNSLVDDICSLYSKGFTKLMCSHTRNDEALAALEAIALYEHYQNINSTKITTLSEFATFLDKASEDYLSYFAGQGLDVIVYADNLDTINLNQMQHAIKQAQLAIALKDVPKQTCPIEKAIQLPVRLNIKDNEKENKHTNITSNKSRHSKNGSENYQHGARFANDWLQIQIAKLDSWDNIRNMISRASLEKVLKSHSRFDDYQRGGLDQYDKVMNEIAPEVQANSSKATF